MTPCTHPAEHRRYYPDQSKCRECGETWPLDADLANRMEELETLLAAMMLRIEDLERR